VQHWRRPHILDEDHTHNTIRFAGALNLPPSKKAVQVEQLEKPCTRVFCGAYWPQELFELASGAFLSLVSFILSGFTATIIFNRPDITPLVQAASFTIFAGALSTAAQSAFTGYDRMELNNITMGC